MKHAVCTPQAINTDHHHLQKDMLIELNSQMTSNRDQESQYQTVPVGVGTGANVFSSLPATTKHHTRPSMTIATAIVANGADPKEPPKLYTPAMNNTATRNESELESKYFRKLESDLYNSR